MKYVVELDGRSLNVDLEEVDKGLRASLDGRSYELTVERPEPGVYVIFDGDKVRQAVVSSEAPGTLSVQLAGRVFNARVIDKKHRGERIEHGVEGEQKLAAPMPGKVVKILIAVGESVEVGQGVLVVEAMKMQNELKSPKSGRVTSMRVTEGENVSANQVLATVE